MMDGKAKWRKAVTLEKVEASFRMEEEEDQSALEKKSTQRMY